MCGKDTEDYFKIKTEGTILKVCIKCSKFGEVIETVKSKPEKKIGKNLAVKPHLPEIVEELIEGYAEKIKSKREKLGLTQKELAMKINEKESIIHKIESSHFTPSVELARKFERFLSIKIVEEVEDSKVVMTQKTSSGGFSLGDFIKVRKK
jgi:putative transcription factor